MLVTKGKRQILQRKSWTCSVNDNKNLNLLRNKLHMAASIAGVLGWINMIHKPRIAQKWIPRYLYPQRLVRSLLKKGDVSNLTKAEIAEILYVEYAGNIYLTKNKKPELTKIIGKILMETQTILQLNIPPNNQ